MEQTLQKVAALKKAGHTVYAYSVGEIWYIDKNDGLSHTIYKRA